MNIKNVEKFAKLEHVALLSVAVLSLSGTINAIHSNNMFNTPIVRANSINHINVKSDLRKHQFVSPELSHLIYSDFEIHDSDLLNKDSDIKDNKVFHFGYGQHKYAINTSKSATAGNSQIFVMSDTKKGFLTDISDGSHSLLSDSDEPRLNYLLTDNDLILNQEHVSSVPKHALKFAKYTISNVTYHKNRKYPYTVTFELVSYSHSKLGNHTVPVSERKNYKLHLHFEQVSGGMKSIADDSNNNVLAP